MSTAKVDRGLFSSVQELRDSLNKGVFLAIFDDANKGSVPDDATSITLMRRLAHAEVISYMGDIYDTLPAELPEKTSYLLKRAELDFIRSLAFERHPEFGKTYTKDYVERLWKRAQTTLDRIISGTQRIAKSDQPPEAKPRNQGGVITDNSQRMICDDANGNRNGGDL